MKVLSQNKPFQRNPIYHLLKQGDFINFIYFTENNIIDVSPDNLNEIIDEKSLLAHFILENKNSLALGINILSTNRDVVDFLDNFILDKYKNNKFFINNKDSKNIISNLSYLTKFSLYLYSKGFDFSTNNGSSFKAMLSNRFFNDKIFNSTKKEFDLIGNIFIENSSKEKLQNMKVGKKSLLLFLLSRGKTSLSKQLIKKGVVLKTDNENIDNIIESVKGYNTFKLIEKQAVKEKWSEEIINNIDRIIKNIPENLTQDKSRIIAEYESLTQKSLRNIADVEYILENKNKKNDIIKFYKEFLISNENSVFDTPFGNISLIDWYIHFFNEDKSISKNKFETYYPNLEILLSYIPINYDAIKGQSKNIQKSDKISKVAYIVDIITHLNHSDGKGKSTSANLRVRLINSLFDNLKNNNCMLSEEQFNNDVLWLKNCYEAEKIRLKKEGKENKTYYLEDDLSFVLSTYYIAASCSGYKLNQNNMDWFLDEVEASNKDNFKNYIRSFMDSSYVLDIFNMTKNNFYSRISSLFLNQEQVNRWKGLIFDVEESIKTSNRIGGINSGINKLIEYNNKNKNIIPDIINAFFEISKKGWDIEIDEVNEVKKIASNAGLNKNNSNMKSQLESFILNNKMKKTVFNNKKRNSPLL